LSHANLFKFPLNSHDFIILSKKSFDKFCKNSFSESHLLSISFDSPHASKIDLELTIFSNVKSSSIKNLLQET